MSNRYAIIENGLVTNVVLADAEFAAEQGWIECPNAGPGWKYDGTTFTEPDPVVAPEPVAPTKEQLMAQLAALSAQIQALE
jgi:hypothetical protein